MQGRSCFAHRSIDSVNSEVNWRQAASAISIGDCFHAPRSHVYLTIHRTLSLLQCRERGRRCAVCASACWAGTLPMYQLPTPRYGPIRLRRKRIGHNNNNNKIGFV